MHIFKMKEERIMSLVLGKGTLPKGLMVKTHGLRGLPKVYLGDYEISVPDFLFMTYYVLTNTDLHSHDHRLQFIKCVKAMKKVDGYMPNRKRLKSTFDPIVIKRKKK